jgi:rod shape-determining protein MreD
VLNRLLRILTLVAFVVIVQVAVFPHMRFFGVVPDLGLLLALAVGYQEGPELGAIAGFLAGFGYDLFLETPLGLNALTYAVVGYTIGVLESGMFRSPRWLPSILGLLGGLAGGLFFIAIGVLAGVDAVKGTQGVRTIALAAVYDALLAPFVFFLVRRVLGSTDRIRDAWSMR